MPSKSSRLNAHIESFNRGEVSAAALARTDLDKLRLAAEVQENLLPYVLGKGVARPGSKYLATTPSSNQARLIPFVFAVDDKALLELSDSLLRVYVNDALVTRASVTSSITNGTFAATEGWITTSRGGGQFVATDGEAILRNPNINGRISIHRSATTSNAGTEHGLRIIVTRNSVTFRCGTTAGADNYISETELGEGEHSLGFTPTDGTYWVWFNTRSEIEVKVDSIAVESAGVMTLPTPWLTADLRDVRFDQSGDIVYCANENYQQRKIERRGTTSWSVVKYYSANGPFTLGRTADIRLDPSGTRQQVTLSADRPFFTSSHVSTLFKLTHTGQRVDQGISTDGGTGGDGSFTDIVSLPLWSAGTTKPAFTYKTTDNASAAATGTWTLERSFEGQDIGFREIVDGTGRNASSTVNVDDTVDTWHRLGVRAGEMSGGVWRFILTTEHGGGDGIIRVVKVSSTTAAVGQVLVHFKETNGTQDWVEGEWSDIFGWPSAVCFFDGRLWWAGRDKIWGSVSDDYENFDATTEGDSGPILRNIATGAVNQARWLLPLIRLIVGTEGSEVSAKSSSLDNPLTPTEFSLRDISTQGSASVSPVKADAIGYFVQRSGKRLYALRFDSGVDYTSLDMTRINDGIAGTGTGFVELSVQRQPDTRVWCVRSDGQVAVLLHEPDEDVAGWARIITAQSDQNATPTDGFIESVCVLPGTDEDDVYMSVKRIINGSAVRYIEKFAKEMNVRGTAGSHFMADSYATEGTATANMATKLTHLNGERVVGWGTATDGTTGPIANGDYLFVTDGTCRLGLIDRRLGTNIGDMTASSGLAGAFDGTTATTANTPSAVTAAYVGKTLAGSSRISAAVCRGVAAAGFTSGANYTLNLYAKQGAAPASSTDGTLLGTTGSLADANDDSTKTITSSDTTTEWDHVWVEVTTSGGAAAFLRMGELSFFSPTTYSNAVVGLQYHWRYKSAKLAYGAQGATSLLQPKKVASLGIIAENFMIDSVDYGKDFDTLYDLPRTRDGETQSTSTVMTVHDERAFPFSGNWDTDSRVCMKGSAPWPCTLLGIVIGLELEEKQ
jgi:hypothetical protein